MTQKTEIISLREFAKRLGVGEKTIRDGVKANKIVKGVVYDDKGRPKINYPVAKIEAESFGLGYRAKLVKEDPAPEEPKPPLPDEKEEENEHIAGLGPATSLSTAQRAEKIFKAQLACLDVEEKAGSLVRKEEVYRQLFEFGIEVKSSISAIPDRITDELISLSHDRNAFHTLLSRSINEALETLSNFKG